MKKLFDALQVKLKPKKMSVNRNRCRIEVVTDNHSYKVINFKEEFPPYWDEGINFYPKFRRGFKNPTKRIMNYQRRMYKTWKHNRNTQYII